MPSAAHPAPHYIAQKPLEMTHFWKRLSANVGAGLLIVVPFAVALFILGKVWAAIHGPVRQLSSRLDLDGVLPANGLFLITAVVLLLLLALVGRTVRSKSPNKARRWLEEKLLMHIPGYAYARVLLEARLGLSEPPEVRPALLRVGDGWQPVFEIERNATGHCVVYLPDVPLGASGSVLVVEATQLTLLEGSVLPLDRALRRYGKGLGTLAQAVLKG